MAALSMATARMLLALPLILMAGPEAGRAANLSIRRWQTEEGLPQNSVTCLRQSRDGYLWFGTYAGLVRFDGVRFEVYDGDHYSDLADSRITALFEDPQGVLWIGHETGNITGFERGEMRAVSLPAAVRRSEILEIAADKTGKIWILNRAGWLAQLNHGTVIEPPPDFGNLYGNCGLALARDGTFWCLRRGRLDVIEGGETRPWISPDQQVLPQVQAICAAETGGLWILMEGGIGRFDSGRWQVEPADQPWRFQSVGCLMELADGDLAVGTEQNGLYLWERGVGRNDGVPKPDHFTFRIPHSSISSWEGGEIRHFNRANGLGQDWVRAVMQDREGTLWVGLGNGGLSALHAVSFEPMNPPDDWGGCAVLSLTAGHDDVLWVGTEGAGIYSWQGGRWSRYETAEGMQIGYVWSLAETNSGQLFAGTWSSGLFVWEQGGFRSVPGLAHPQRPITALLAGAGDEIWVGTADGVGRYESGRWTWLPERDGVRLANVRCLALGADGALWIGMYGGGLACYQAGQYQRYTKADGLGSDCISCLYFDAHGALWIGTSGGGLARFKARRFTRIGSRQGLPSVSISSMQADQFGHVWLGSSAGVLRIDKAALDACAEGRASNLVVSTYGRGDGLATIECSSGFQPASCQTADGCLWFPTRRGLVRVNPAALVTNSLPPPVRIEQFRCQDEEFPVPPAAGEKVLKIPPGRERFEFQFTALSFVAPEKVRFKYRLLGLERDWVERRQRSAAYSHLRPGNYVFQVMACNDNGVWNEREAQLAFTVLPHFWQTWWFQVLVYTVGCLVVAAAVLLETRRRLQRRLKDLERQRTVERERARIAQDIHDDLGASLTRITMLSQTARKELASTAAVDRHLARIEGTARELTRAMDETVWAINPRHDTLDSLASYLVRFAQDFLAPAGIRCRVDMPLTLPEWPIGADLRHNVFLACKEAINNIVRHAQANEAKIALHPHAAGFDLVIEDDGQGFELPQAPPAGAARSGHSADRNGLRNMRTRMTEIGGSITMESHLGQGTTVRFRVPVKDRLEPSRTAMHRQN